MVAAVPTTTPCRTEAFIPMYAAAMFVSDWITAVLLFAQFAILRSHALLAISSVYLFTALILIPLVLTFPGLFAPGGLLGAGLQSTAWLYFLWHIGFPLFVIAYALLKNADPSKRRWKGARSAAILSSAAVAVAAVRGAYEFQGQKCSAASRMYVPKSRWNDIRDRMVAMMKDIKVGDVRDFRNFMGAVIDKKSFDKISGYIDDGKKNAKVIHGGGCKGDEGYFIEPTLVETKDPGYRLLCEEIFGPVVTAYVYDDAAWSKTLETIDRTSPYALTGSVFSTDRAAVLEATDTLRNAAGNFYINDKPTGAVVGQQPFGGARASGTNDKAGSKINLLRWVSARTIKETFSPPRDHKYPYMSEE